MVLNFYKKHFGEEKNNSFSPQAVYRLTTWLYFVIISRASCKQMENFLILDKNLKYHSIKFLITLDELSSSMD